MNRIIIADVRFYYKPKSRLVTVIRIIRETYQTVASLLSAPLLLLIQSRSFSATEVLDLGTRSMRNNGET